MTSSASSSRKGTLHTRCRRRSRSTISPPHSNGSPTGRPSGSGSLRRSRGLSSGVSASWCFGSLRDSISAISAITASTESAGRAARRGGRSRSRRRSRRRGRRDVRLRRARHRGRRRRRTARRSSTRPCAFDTADCGTAGLPAMPVKNDVVSADISTAPASAVPIDAPRFVKVFCSPPTSPLRSSGTDRDGDRAELRRQRAHAEAGEQQWPGDDLRAGADVEQRRPARRGRGRVRGSRTATTRRGDAFGNTFGNPTAASSSVIDSGSRRTPVAIADRPSATDRKSGIAKNSPACSRYWKKNAIEAGAQRGIRGCREVDQRLLAASDAAVQPAAGTAVQHRRRRRGSARSTGDKPEPLRRVRASAGRSPTCPSAARRRRSGRARGPTARCRRGRGARRCSAAGSAIRRGEQQDHDHDEHFADEHPAPRRVRREEPADQRAGRHCDGARRRDEAVAPAAVRSRPKFDATSATIAGRISAAPMPSRNDQPSMSTPRVGASAVVNDPPP